MDFRVNTEQRSYTRSENDTYEIRHLYGPCLACDAVEVEHVWNENWVRRQYRPEKRRKLIRSLERGNGDDKSPLVFKTLKSLLCSDCAARYSEVRSRRAEVERLAREQEKQQQQQDELVYAQSREWRQPQAGEFARECGTELFIASLRGVEHEVLFRWRISNRCQCRGNDAGAVVGMWVDGTLTAHYYGWEFTAYRWENYMEETEFSQDRFGHGFRCWLEHQFQDLLLLATPDVAWSVLDDDLMDEVGSQSWLVHVTWHDGAKYAKVGPLPAIEDAAEFARKHMGMNILGSDYRAVGAKPVHP